MSKKSQKLVRDKIPEIIKADGLNPITRILEDDEYQKELIKKLQEEVSEFSETPCVEEMADIEEVLIALREHMAISKEELEDFRTTKANSNGAFQKRIFLVGVE